MDKDTLAIPPKIQGIDGLRGLAMLMVFLFHVWEFSGHPTYTVAGFPFGTLFGALHIRVDLFTTLSGFGLMYQYLRNPNAWDVVGFFKRRWWRIAPAYYVSILFLLALPNILVVSTRLFGMESKVQPIPDWIQIVTHITFTHALFNDTWAGIQGAYWSIGLEAQLYALFSIFILSTKRFGFRTVLIFGVITSLAFLVVAYAIDLSHVFLLSALGRFVHFCAGILVAKILFLNQMHRFRAIAIIGTSCIVLSQLKNQLSIPTFIPFVEIMSASGFMCLLILTCLNDDLVKWLSSRWLRWLGGVSYSVFLIHQNVAWYIGEFFKKIFPVNQELLMPMFIIIALPICVCLGLILNRFVEEPFRRGWPIRKA